MKYFRTFMFVNLFLFAPMIYAASPIAVPTPTNPNAPNYNEMKCEVSGIQPHLVYKCDTSKVCNLGYVFVAGKVQPDVGNCVKK